MATSQNILNVSKHIQGVDLNEFPAHFKSNVKVCNAHYMHNFGVMVVYTKVNAFTRSPAWRPPHFATTLPQGPHKCSRWQMGRILLPLQWNTNS